MCHVALKEPIFLYKITKCRALGVLIFLELEVCGRMVWSVDMDARWKEPRLTSQNVLGGWVNASD